MKFILLFFICMIFSFQTFATSNILIKDAEIKLPPPGMEVSAIYLKLVNQSKKDISLVEVKGSFAKKFELHNMEMKENMMKMRQVNSILIKKDSEIELKSGGYHIMVFDIVKKLKLNEYYDLTLIFDDKSQKTIKVKGIDGFK